MLKGWNWKEEKIQLWKGEKKTRINQVNPSNFLFRSWDYDNLIKSKLKKRWSLIPNEHNIEMMELSGKKVN